MVDIKDHIKVFEGVVPTALCDALCAEFCDSDEWAETAIADNVVDKSFRSASVIHLSSPDVINKREAVRTGFDTQLFAAAGAAMKQYLSFFPLVPVGKDTGYDLLRYQTGQFYKQHTDASANFNRCVSCSLVLNDDYEGGEFAFFNRDVVIAVPKGAAILFPSNFMYPHEILPVVSGTRYSVATWFV